MTSRDSGLWSLLPARVRRLPADLIAVVGVVLVTNLVIFAPLLRETPIRIGVGLVFLLFVPGYVIAATLFPEAGTEPVDTDTGGDDTDDRRDSSSQFDRDSEGIDGIERVALSLGLSIVVVPLIGLALHFTPWGIRLTPIMVSLSVFTLGLVWIAAERRLALPVDDRFRVPYRSWLSAGRAELLEPDTNGDLAFTLLLVASILLAVGSVGYIAGVPNQSEAFTEFYLLNENEEGELVADGFPANVTRGESTELVVGVSNQEHQRSDYTVVVELQRVDVRNASSGAISVEEETELRRFQVTLADNETVRHSHTITPTMTGDNLRLKYLLYRGDAPSDPKASTASLDQHLWVNVTAPPDDNG
jgi:uncharacterized membrane protein